MLYALVTKGIKDREHEICAIFSNFSVKLEMVADYQEVSKFVYLKSSSFLLVRQTS